MVTNRDAGANSSNYGRIGAKLYNTNGSVNKTIQMEFVVSATEGYVTFSHVVRPPVFASATSLPSDVPVGSMAIKEVSAGVYYPVWFDGASWYRPDGRTAI